VEERPQLPKPGDVLGGKYELVRMLGSGGMGAVFEARHVRLGQAVAIKFLKPELVSDQDHVARFAREGRAAARMRSQHAARVFDVDTTPAGIPYMVIELLDGHDLQEELRSRGKLPVEEAVDIVLQACSAMAEAHLLGIVHRDLKPANLFSCSKTSGRLIKVLDFGVSKLVEDELAHTTAPSVTLGTPHYMSPEQITAAKDVDSQSDIWSLGVILYRLIAGQLPHVADSATAFVVTVVNTPAVPLDQVATVPAELAAAVMKALEKSRAERWATVEELGRAIQPFGSGAVAFKPPSQPPPSLRGFQREVDRTPTGPAEPTEINVDVPIEVAPTEANFANVPSVSQQRRAMRVPIAGMLVVVVASAALAVFALSRKPPASATSAAATSPESAAPAASSLPPASEPPASTPSAAAIPPPERTPSATPRTTRPLPAPRKPAAPATEVKPDRNDPSRDPVHL
jgi:serine/threonine-protein kinase